MELQLSCCLAGLWLLPAGLTSGLTGFDEQILNELRSLHAVDLQDTDAKELPGQILDILLVHFVLLDDAQNEAALTFGAVPTCTIRLRLGVYVVAVDLVRAAVLLWMTIARALDAVVAVVVRWNKPDFLDVFIDCLLEQLIKTTAFRLDLAQICELSADGDGVLMRGIAGEAELLRVIDFEGDSHGGVVVAVNGHKKTRL